MTRFASTFGTLKFDENSFFHTILGFHPYWDYKPTNAIHADSPGVYTSDKIILNINRINKIHLKCDCIDGSIQDGVRQPTLFSFILDKPSGYKAFCEPETIHYKKINNSVLNTMTFYLEVDNNEEVDFNGETLSFTLQMIKIWTNMFFVLLLSSQKFKTDSYCVGGRHKSATRDIVGDITFNKKSGQEVNLLVGKCVICNRKKALIVSDNVIQPEGLGVFFWKSR